MGTEQRVGLRDFGRWARAVLWPERAYLGLALIYGLGISLLLLAAPISVQLLINSIANTAHPAPLFTLSAVLFLLLLLACALSALRTHLMAMFERRLFARIMAEITLRAVHARDPFFADARRGDLFNRYFDLFLVQKAVPSLLTRGFSIVLQAAVGLAITSFYHPFFLAFNAMVVAAILAIWRLWSRGAMRTAVALSHEKYDAAGWLESVGGSNGFYKSARHLGFAMDRSEQHTARYVAAHRRYFRYSFAQTLAFLLLYALSSAGLLALGGWLVLKGQLSIGQLVAAELILSGVFYGISQLGTYLDVFYDLVAGTEEVALLFDIPQESPSPDSREPVADGALSLKGVVLGDVTLDLDISSGAQLAAVAEPGVDAALGLLLKRHERPARGLVTLGGIDINALDMYWLRSDIIVLDRPTIVEVTIREYLRLAASGTPAGEVQAALAAVGLDARIARLPQGLDTPLSSTGYPLSIGEVMALKLAAAVLGRPKLLMLSPLFDLLDPARVRQALTRLRPAGTTVLVCTGRPSSHALDGWLWLGPHRQEHLPNRQSVEDHLAASGGIHALPA